MLILMLIFCLYKIQNVDILLIHGALHVWVTIFGQDGRSSLLFLHNWFIWHCCSNQIGQVGKNFLHIWAFIWILILAFYYEVYDVISKLVIYLAELIYPLLILFSPWSCFIIQWWIVIFFSISSNFSHLVLVSKICNCHINFFPSNHMPLYVYSGILIQMVRSFKEGMTHWSKKLQHFASGKKTVA